MNAINDYAKERKLDGIALNLGCGARRMEGWINIDGHDYEKKDSSRTGSLYDMKMDIRSLDVADASVDIIMLVHVVEHFVRWETLKMMKHYHQKLKPGGQLVVEMPDLIKCLEWMQKGPDAPYIQTPLGYMNMGRTQLYGNQWDELDYETHRYVWTLHEFTTELTKLGFEIIQADHEAKFHQKGRDMYVVAIKR